MTDTVTKQVAAAILFEQESLCRNIAPRRKTRKDITADSGQRAKTGGGDTVGSLCARTGQSISTQDASQGHLLAAPVASTLNAAFGDKLGLEDQHINSGAPLFVLQDTQAVAFKPSHYTRGKDGAPSDITPPLSADADRGDQDAVVCAPIAFAQNTRDETSYVAEPITIMERGRKDGPNLEHRQDGTANTLLTPNGGRGGMGVGAIAFKERGGCEGGGKGYLGSLEKAFTLSTSHDQSIFANYAVRRLTPVECARLQAFPDNFTQIPWRNKPADKCPDGPQHKAYGNSMATNVIRWIGQRIELIDNIRNSGTSPQ